MQQSLLIMKISSSDKIEALEAAINILQCNERGPASHEYNACGEGLKGNCVCANPKIVEILEVIKTEI